MVNINIAKRSVQKPPRTATLKIRLDAQIEDALQHLTECVVARYNERVDARLNGDTLDWYPIRGDIGKSAVLRALVVNACRGNPQAEIERIIETLRAQAD